MTDEDKTKLAVLAFDCARAVLEGMDTITVTIRKKRLPGFPVGQLLSVGSNGSHNYAVCPVKILAWIHAGTKGERLARHSTTPNANIRRQ